MTNKEETNVTESQIVRASVLESHGWSSEQNRNQCKFRIQEINSLVFFVTLIFSFRSSPLLFILCDKSNAIQITKRLCHDDYYDAAAANGDCCNYCGLLLSRKLWT